MSAKRHPGAPRHRLWDVAPGSIQTRSAMRQENAFQASAAALALEDRDRVGIRRNGHPSEHPPGTFTFRRYRPNEMSSAFFVYSDFDACHVLVAPKNIRLRARSGTQTNQTSF